MKRSRALVISWFRYHPKGGEGYRVMWDHWLSNFQMWAGEVDSFYLIDQGMNFTPDDVEKLKEILPNTKVLQSEVEGHHWSQFKWVIPQIQEDNILFLDNDVVIKKVGIVDSWFKKIESGADFVGNFDGSGGMQDIIKEKYPIMKELGNRMGTYYFVITKNLLNKIGEYTFEPNYFETGTYIPELDYTTKENDWLDSFGLFTLKMLSVGANLVSIPDPRDSIYLQPENDNWIISKDPEEPIDLGYYHIRNGNLANYIMTSKTVGNDSDYQREIGSSKREILRILAWMTWMDTKHNMEKDTKTLLYDLGVSEEKWIEYMSEFNKYHKLI